MIGVLTAALLLLWPPATASQNSAGAAIRGVLVTDDAAPQPVRHARVELAGGRSDAVITGDDGAFAFTGLAAGRYQLSAEKPGIGRRVYSANTASPAPTVLVLDTGQQLAALKFVLPKGGVIAGTITDVSGAPVDGAVVTAMARNPSAVDDEAVSSVSDDEGRYRLFGLAPGEYLVRAAPVRTAAETPQLVDTYYPNTSVPGEAAGILVAAREERLGVDITIRRARFVTVSGTVRDSAGQPVDADVRLSRGVGDEQSTAARAGAFRFAAVAPGSYMLRATRKAAAGEGASRQVTFTATVPLEVGDRSDSSILLVVQPPVTLSGRASADNSGARLQLVLTRGGDAFGATMRADGSFVFEDLVPGEYRLRPVARAESDPNVWLVSQATIDGRDALRQPIVVSAAPLAGLSVMLTSQVGSLHGRLTRASGAGAPELAIVVISADPQRRAASGSPSIVWPDSNGEWSIEALAAGEYRVAALADVTASDLSRPDFLDAIAAAAVPVTIAAGVAANLDLTIR